jgi:hypothetical protein
MGIRSALRRVESLSADSPWKKLPRPSRIRRAAFFSFEFALIAGLTAYIGNRADPTTAWWITAMVLTALFATYFAGLAINVDAAWRWFNWVLLLLVILAVTAVAIFGVTLLLMRG